MTKRVVCNAGEKQCAGSVLKTCKADGSGWNQIACLYGCQDSICSSEPIAVKPSTEAECLNHGFWISHTCYLEGKPVSGGYIACPPGTGKGYKYWHLYQGSSFGQTDSSKRPRTEAECLNQGFWIEATHTCYLENEPVSGGYIACPPGTGRGFPYWHLYQGESCTPIIISVLPGCGAEYEPCCGGRNGTCSNSNLYCSSVDSGTCLPKQSGGSGNGSSVESEGFFLQKDSQWQNDFSVTVSCNGYEVVKTLAQIGCGPTSVANILNEYSGQNVTPIQIAQQIIGWACGGTSYASNLAILETNGFQADPFPVSLYHLTDYMQPDEALWISANVGGIAHHTYMDGYTINEQGIAVYNLRDPYFGSDITCTVENESTFNCLTPDKRTIIINAEASALFILTPPGS
jgi:hypothetical protein